MSEALSQWIITRINELGWSIRELGRRGDLNSSYLSRVLSGKQDPGAKFYLGVAKAFEVPIERLKAIDMGIDPLEDEDITFDELLELARKLTPDQRQTIVDFAEFLAKKHRNEASEKS